MEAAHPESFYRSFARALSSVGGGKRIATDVYFHISHPSIARVLAIARVERMDGANVVRFGTRKAKATLSFLSYRNFFEDPFPQLEWSVHVTLPQSVATKRTEGRNPAILHRKELLLPRGHADYNRYAALSKQLEESHLLPANSFIGRKEHWARYLCERGFDVIDGRLVAKDDR
jgi:hypothetical protein